MILYDLLGPGPQFCHWCKQEIYWHPKHRCDRLEVDHLDRNGLNNSPSNLVASCQPCNTRRGRGIPDGIPVVVRSNGLRHRAVGRVCEGCGKEFLTAATKSSGFTAPPPGKGRFCSPSCRARSRKVSAETRAKLSASGLGRNVSPETRAKISASHRGRPMSAAARAKMKNAMTPERREQIGAVHRGKTVSPETRAKISASLKGRKLSPESRAKMSAAHRARHARLKSKP
jgi:NUMOD3 motif